MGACKSVDQLRGNPHSPARLANRTFQDVAHSQSMYAQCMYARGYRVPGFSPSPDSPGYQGELPGPAAHNGAPKARNRDDADRLPVVVASADRILHTPNTDYRSSCSTADHLTPPVRPDWRSLRGSLGSHETPRWRKGDSNPRSHCEQNGHARASARTAASLESTSAKGGARADGASQPLVDQARLSPVRRSPIRGLLAV